MSRVRIAVLSAALFVAAATPSWADATAFIGANTTPANHQVRGFAVGAGLLLVAFEFEYANSPESTDPFSTVPSLRTGMGNLLLQAPFAIHGFQPYVTTGAGIYRERLGTHVETGLSPNFGGGIKVSLAGPLRLRVDYRVFRLGNGALYSPAHRVYAGLNLKF
jgi:hypothetical protein